MRSWLIGVASALVIALAACGGDDGASVRNLGGDCPSGSGTHASGTAASGTAASGTEASGTEASGTEASGTHASGSASGTDC